MNHKKILYVINQYPAISHTFIDNEIRGLNESGFEIVRHSINRPDRPNTELTDHEKSEASKTTIIKSELKQNPFQYLSFAVSKIDKAPSLIKLLWNCSKKGRISKNLSYLLAALVTAKHAEEQKIDQIHAHFSTQAASIAMYASHLTSIDYSITVHGPDEFYDAEGQNLTTKYATASQIIAISKFAKSQVLKHLKLSQWDKVQINYLGVDVKKFSNQDKTEPAVNASEPLPLRILCIGRLVNAKGQGILLRAAKEIKDNPIELIFAGDGPDRAELETYATANNINATFLGNVNPDKISSLHTKADIFVLPSFAEGIPIVLMEAMAAGLACITTSITGIPELISNGDNGILVPAGSVKDLADAIENLCEDREYANKLGKAGNKTIQARWKLAESNERLVKIFEMNKA